MARHARVIKFPGSATPAPREDGGLVEVYRCDRAEAVVVKSLFEGEGIPTFFRSRIAHSVHPFTVGDQGEVVVMVPGSEAVRARRLIARVQRGPAAS